MKKIILKGDLMTSRRRAHLHMQEKLDSKEYYGRNLDALWDVLSTYSQPIEIVLENKDKLLENLETYGESIIKIFEEAQSENSNINFKLLNDKQE